jgi:hypothetical protein
MKTCGEWRYSSAILDLGTSWRLVVSFTAKPLYTGGKILFPLDMTLSGPPEPVWALCRRKKYLKSSVCIYL